MLLKCFSGFAGDKKETVNGPLYLSDQFNIPLHVQQPVETFLHRESRELPFYYMGEPDEGSHVVEIYRTECLLRPLYIEARLLKQVSLRLKIIVAEGNWRAGKHFLIHIPVV